MTESKIPCDPAPRAKRMDKTLTGRRKLGGSWWGRCTLLRSAFLLNMTFLAKITV